MSDDELQVHKVKKGQITFDAEGNDVAGSIYFSRVVHWPGNSESGVTIGRGYDMGGRSETDVKKEMMAAGIAEKQADSLAQGAGLKGDKAKKFVDSNKESLGAITHAQQVKLFDNIYPAYEQRAKRNYNTWTNAEKDRVVWNELSLPVRDILVDFVYQGFTKGPNPMKAGMKNDIEQLINYIESTPEIKQYEPGRNRAKYLRQAKNKLAMSTN